MRVPCIINSNVDILAIAETHLLMMYVMLMAIHGLVLTVKLFIEMQEMGLEVLDFL